MSDTLFHTVEDLPRLIEILCEGFAPNFHIEDLSIPKGNELFLGIPMVSFSNIDYEKIKESGEYGEYVIGLRMQWALGCRDLNPVLYISDSNLLNSVQNDLIGSDLLGFIKKYSSPWKDMPDYVNYSECEWRYVVKNSFVGWMKSKAEYDEWRGDITQKRPKPTEELKKYSLRFAIEDITHLVVKTHEDKRRLLKDLFLNKRNPGNMGQVNEEDLKHLESVITVLS